MAIFADVQPYRERDESMTKRADIAAMLHDLDHRSPAGCAIALHIKFTTPTFMFQTYSRRWLDHYSASGLVMYDPVAHWGLQNIGRIRWSDLERIDSQGVLEQAKNFGMMNGVAISIVRAGSRSIAGFARADRDYDDSEIEAMEALLERLHLSTTGPNQLNDSDQRALTELSIRLTH